MTSNVQVEARRRDGMRRLQDVDVCRDCHGSGFAPPHKDSGEDGMCLECLGHGSPPYGPIWPDGL